ncbi:hypothetical protein SCHPADRAFT_906038 [Schizopora paradoxa]|uniref:Uncharacterized protein n=1 Tax=Schizopora paradoxa TaxID=27342 RepID=A0A0H2S3B1_9AGAM|nr:hypothetical protein SCHPADRAFT_906038 [Schizopora paradoxa]
MCEVDRAAVPNHVKSMELRKFVTSSSQRRVWSKHVPASCSGVCNGFGSAPHNTPAVDHTLDRPMQITRTI